MDPGESERPRMEEVGEGGRPMQDERFEGGWNIGQGNKQKAKPQRHTIMVWGWGGTRMPKGRQRAAGPWRREVRPWECARESKKHARAGKTRSGNRVG